METKSKEIELEIGAVTYSFTVIFGYYAGLVSASGDPTEGSDTEYQGYSIDGEITAYHNETEREWTVIDQSEIAIVREWFNDEAEFWGA